MTRSHIVAVDPAQAGRLLNFGGTVLVSAEHDGKTDMMPASWNAPLDFNKATVVIDRTHYPRELMDASDCFALGVAGAGHLPELMRLGSVSKHDDPEKLEKSRMKFFTMPGWKMPLAEGCLAWVIVRKLPECAEMAAKYDLFLGEIVAAWADDRVFADGNWTIPAEERSLRTTHYISGGRFHVLGDLVEIE